MQQMNSEQTTNKRRNPTVGFQPTAINRKRLELTVKRKFKGQHGAKSRVLNEALDFYYSHKVEV